MPRAATHDVVTTALAAPAAGLVFLATGAVIPAVAAGFAFLFGGLMFGPDLDTPSRQYSRWTVFRFLWLPYRKFFRHRSRFSHGLLFGALLRVVYFLGAVTLTACAVLTVVSLVTGSQGLEMSAVADTWRAVGTFARTQLGWTNIGAVFFGLWAGAASHTFTDMVGSYIRTGRVIDYL